MMKLFHGSESEVFICSPFLGEKIVSEIVALRGKRRVRFLTSASPSNRDAFIVLYDEDVEVRILMNLHAKVYLFDDAIAVITSSNLTENGLEHNEEIGILIESCEIIDQLSKELERLWEEGVDLRDIDPEDILSMPEEEPADVLKLGIVTLRFPQETREEPVVSQARIWEELVSLSKKIRLNRFILADLLIDPERRRSEGEVPPMSEEDEPDTKGLRLMLDEWEYHEEGMTITPEKLEAALQKGKKLNIETLTDVVIERLSSEVEGHELLTDRHKSYLKALYNAAGGKREWVSSDEWLAQCRREGVRTNEGELPKSISPFMTRRVFYISGLIEMRGSPKEYRLTKLGKLFVERRCK